MPSSPPKGCRIVLLGAPGITTAAGPIPTTKPVVFAAALHLAMNRGMPVRRDRLAALLWPDADDATRSDRMRWLAAELKRSGIAVANRSPELGFERAAVELDIDELASAESAERVLAVARGDALEGFEPALSDTMMRWLEETRDEVRTIAVRALERWLAVTRRAEDWATTESLARRLLAIAPHRAGAAAALAEAGAMQGRRSVAAAAVPSSDAGALIGRSGVLAQLLRGLESPGPVARRFGVAGPPGIGKTRLLDEFRGAARRLGVQVASLRCDRSDTLRPLSLAVDLARSLLQLRGALGASPDAIEVLRHFTGAVSAEDPTPDSSRRAAVYAALSEVVDAVTDEGPLAVVIDDAQWAEPGSWGLVAPLLARRARTAPRWLVGLRAETLDDATRAYSAIFPADGAEADQDREMHWLAPLDGAQIEALCIARAAPRRIAAAELDDLVQRTGGIPFIAEALVDHWLGGGNVVTLPPSVTRLVDTRLERLSPVAQRALAAVAVLGADATSSALQSVSALDRRELMSATRELETAGIMRTAEDGRVAPHALWTEAALRHTPQGVMQLLHRYAAEWLEQSVGGADAAEPRRHWAIAAHWIDAGEPARAQRALDDAAMTLAASGFAAEGAAMLERAANMAGVSEVALHYWRRTAELYMADRGQASTLAVIRIHGKYDSIGSTLHGAAWDPHHDVELLSLAAANRLTDPVDLPAQYAVCVRSQTASVSHRLYAAHELFYRLSHIHLDRSTVVAIWQSIEHLPLTNALDELAFDLVAAQYHTRATRQIQTGLEHALRARDAFLAQNLRSDRRYFTLLVLISDCHEYLGDLEAAQATRREMLSYGQQSKRTTLVYFALSGLVGTALEAGRIAEARAYLHLIEQARQGHSRDEVMAWAIYRAVCALEEGDATRARAEFTMPLDTSEGNGLLPARNRAIYAHIALLEGDDDTVDLLLPRLLECFSTPMAFMDHPAYVAGMCLARRQGAEAAAAFVQRFLNEWRLERWTPREELVRLAEGLPATMRSCLDAHATAGHPAAAGAC